MTRTYTIITRHSKDCAHKDDPFYKRCQCWKHLRWFEKGIPNTVTTKSRTWAGAEEFKREEEQKLRTPVAHQPTNVTVRDAVRTYMAAKKGENLSAGFIARTELDLERMTTFLEKHIPPVFQLNQVSLTDLSGFRASWPDTLRSNTRAGTQVRLKSFFKWAVLAYNLPRSPAQGLRAINTNDTPETQPLTPQEYQAMLDVIPQCFAPQKGESDTGVRMRALVMLMRHSGLAISDALTLPRPQTGLKAYAGAELQVENKITYIVKSRMKTGVPIRVPLPPEVVVALDAIQGDRKYYFWSGKSKIQSLKQLYSIYFVRLFEAAQIDCGESVMRSHRLRDTAAVEWLKLGFDLYAVAKLLGHTSVKTTEKHYAKWVTDLQRAAEQRLIASWDNPAPNQGH